MPEDCLFCRIASAEIEAPIVFQNADFLAFLDHRPLFPGHTLLIPRGHCPTLMDLPQSMLGPLFSHASMLCRAMEDGLHAEGSFVAVNNRVSQSVPHLHVHVVPRRPKDGLRGFFWPRGKYRDAAEAESVRTALQHAIHRQDANLSGMPNVIP